MTRLDSFIARLQAQRACLDHVAGLVRSLDGLVLELGLGNGRTFDHLRHRLPGHEIVVFERHPAAHPDSTPDPRHLVVGDLETTLPAAAARWPGRAVLAHSDIGTGDAGRNRRFAAWLALSLPPLLAPGAVVASDQALGDDRLAPLPLPATVPPGRYFLYRRRI